MSVLRSGTRYHWGGLLLIGCGAFIGCSEADSPPTDTPMAGAGPSGAGTGGGAGTSSTPSGGTGSGVAGSSAQAGAGSSSGGSAAAGSSAGGSTGAGSGGGGAGGGGAAGAGGSGGASGAAGTGGSSGSGGSGGSGSIAGKLDGFGWVMKCNKADTSSGAENRCYLLPQNGQGQCGAGYTSVDETIQFGGTPGTTYMVALHLRGSQEAGDYSGGTQLTKEFLKNATHNDGLHNFLSMDVSSPKATYFPNAGAGGGTVVNYDYKVTIPIEGGATIHLKAFDKDCLQHRFCPDKTYMNCGFVLEPFSPKGSPIDGDFMFITVDSVTPM